MTIPTSDPSVTTPYDHIGYLYAAADGASRESRDYLVKHFQDLSLEIQHLREERDKLRQQNITLLNQFAEINEEKNNDRTSNF